MAGITSVTTTALFWETLDDLRRTSNYAFLREQIDDLVVGKTRSLGPVNGRDKAFIKDGYLDGIWHCAISRNPDVVLFYTVEGGALNLAMLGTHHDYPSDGKNASASPRTGGRVRNAIRSGHVPSPQWDSIRWSRPSQLVGHRELGEASRAALDAIIGTLQQEADGGEIYRRVHGHDIMDGTYEAMDAWLAEVEQAMAAVLEARNQRPLSAEAALERLVASRSRVPA